MAGKEYIPLTPARQRGGFAFVTTSRSRLWLGKDHLLLITTDGYTETYKRFYFQDIQALVMRRSKRWGVIAAISGFFMAVFGAISLGISTIEVRWVFGILGVICAIPFIANLILGPTVTCELRTAVQVESLPSMSRVRRVRKVLNRIRPLITEAQGQITGEEVAARLREATGTAVPGLVAPETAPPLTS